MRRPLSVIKQKEVGTTLNGVHHSVGDSQLSRAVERSRRAAGMRSPRRRNRAGIKIASGVAVARPGACLLLDALKDDLAYPI